MESSLKTRRNYSPSVKRTFVAPPTPEMEMRAVKVLRKNTSSEKQFIDEVRMLGLEHHLPAK